MSTVDEIVAQVNGNDSNFADECDPNTEVISKESFDKLLEVLKRVIEQRDYVIREMAKQFPGSEYVGERTSHVFNQALIDQAQNINQNSQPQTKGQL